jgi:hypothetical protein
MALQFIDNQPIDFRTSLPSDSDCKSGIGCGDFCAPYQIGDPIIFQFKNPACYNPVLECNPGLVNTNPNLITNGTFDTNSNWTFGTGWAYDATNLTAKRTSASSGILYQTLTITTGKSYNVKFKFGTGPCIGFGCTSTPNLTVKLGGTAHPTTFTASGEYSINIIAGASGKIEFTLAHNNGYIDNVEVYESIISNDILNFCLYTPTINSWVQDFSGSVRHTSGNTDSLYEKITAPAAQGYLKIAVTVTGLTGGSCAVVFHDAYPTSSYQLGTITGNGTYYFYAGWTNVTLPRTFLLQYDPTDDFDATLAWTVSDISFYSPIVLKPQNGGPVINLNQPGVIFYNGDYITVNYVIPPTTYQGIYNICLFDLCLTFLDCDGILDYDIDTCAWSGLYLQCPGGGRFAITQPSTPTTIFYPDDWESCMYGWGAASMQYSLEIGSVDSPGGIEIWLINQNTGDELALICSDVQPSTTYEGVIGVYNDDPFCTFGFKVKFTGASAPGDTFEVLKLRLKILYTSELSAAHCSNCIDIAVTHKCTQWVSGDMDQDYGFGFNFSGNFKIAGRIRSMFINPKYKGELQRYADAGGTFTITRTESGKVYIFVIDYAPERTHDWVRLAVLCDEIRIGASYSNYRLWVNTEGDYQPEWPDNLGNFPLAQCRVELQAKTDVLYNNNAG